MQTGPPWQCTFNTPNDKPKKTMRCPWVCAQSWMVHPGPWIAPRNCVGPPAHREVSSMGANMLFLAPCRPRAQRGTLTPLLMTAESIEVLESRVQCKTSGRKFSLAQGPIRCHSMTETTAWETHAHPMAVQPRIGPSRTTTNFAERATFPDSQTSMQQRCQLPIANEFMVCGREA